MFHLLRRSQRIDQLEVAAHCREHRGQLCIVAENRPTTTPNENDDAAGELQYVAVTCPLQISQRKCIHSRAERSLELPPGVAFSMGVGAHGRQPTCCYRARIFSAYHSWLSRASRSRTNRSRRRSACCSEEPGAARRPAPGGDEDDRPPVPRTSTDDTRSRLRRTSKRVL